MAKLQEAILRDTLANRPAAGKAGRVFYDTTNSQLQRDNGSSWDAIEGAGGATDHGALTGLADDDHPQYVRESEFGAKGRLLVGTGSGTLDDLPVGTDGHLLTADSAETMGVKWAAAAGGGGSRLPFDAVALHGTYGDDFASTTLAAKWTRHNISHGDESFDGSTEGWMSVDLTDLTAHANYSQDTFTTADEFEVVLSATLYYYGSASNIQFGPYIVDATGDGIGVMIFGGLAQLVVVDNYDYSSAGSTLTLGDDEAWNDVKVWLNLVKKGTLYFGRYSFDGNTWSRYSVHAASAVTVAGVGHGRLDESAATEEKQYRVDRFNVIKHLSRSANRVITPSSGTATYSASSTFGGFPAGNAADASTTTQWVANGNADSPTYWQVAWSVAQSINRVMIFQHTGDNFGSGYLEFSDGSRVSIGQAVKASRWIPVDFPTISTTSLRVASTRGKGTNPSLGEVEAYLAS